MRKIRIGNDIHFRWRIKRDGNEENFEDKRVMVLLRDAYGHRCEIDWRVVQAGVIEGTFYGKDQERLGIYSLTLVENDGEKAMNTVDSIRVWQLVSQQERARTSDEEEDSSPVKTVVADFDSDFGIGTLNVTFYVDTEFDRDSEHAIANKTVTRKFETVDGMLVEVTEELPTAITEDDINSVFG